MAALRVFISHASADSAFAERLAADMRNAGADVWLDSTHLTGPGDFVARISQALNERDVLVLVLSPAAIASQWVPDEMNAAIVRAKQGYMYSPLVVQYGNVSTRDIPGLWTTYQRIDATNDYTSALSRILKALDLKQPTPSRVPSPRNAPTPITYDSSTASLPPLSKPITALSRNRPLAEASLIRIGLIDGVILAIVRFATVFLQVNWIGLPPLPAELFSLIAVLPIMAFVAGFYVSVKSAKIRDDLLAGMWAGILGSLLYTIGIALYFNMKMEQLAETFNIKNHRNPGSDIVCASVRTYTGSNRLHHWYRNWRVRRRGGSLAHEILAHIILRSPAVLCKRECSARHAILASNERMFLSGARVRVTRCKISLV